MERFEKELYLLKCACNLVKKSIKNKFCRYVIKHILKICVFCANITLKMKSAPGQCPGLIIAYIIINVERSEESEPAHVGEVLTVGQKIAFRIHAQGVAVGGRVGEFLIELVGHDGAVLRGDFQLLGAVEV